MYFIRQEIYYYLNYGRFTVCVLFMIKDSDGYDILLCYGAASLGGLVSCRKSAFRVVIFCRARLFDGKGMSRVVL